MAWEALAAAPTTGLAWKVVAFFVFVGASFAYLSTRGGATNLRLCSTWAAPRQPGLAAAPRSGGGMLGAAPGGSAPILGSHATFLPPDALMRGTSNYGSGARMQRLGLKLLQGQPVTVAFLGGSITWGRGGYEGQPFTTRFAAWLNATFPHPRHKIVNLGMPAVTSSLFAACYDSVPQDADLVVLEFAVNDGHMLPHWRDKYGYSFNNGMRRGFEQLVRKSLKLPHAPAVAMLHFFSWNATRDKAKVDGVDESVGNSFFFRTIEDELSVIAQYYDAPVLSMRNAAYHLLRQQQPGFQWNVSVHFLNNATEEVEQLKQSQFYWDENHPWDRTGHRALAELLQAAVTRGVLVAAEVQLNQLAHVNALMTAPTIVALGRGLAGARTVQEAEGLPPPMVPGNYEANATSCHLQEDFQGVIREAEGFKYEPRAPAETTFVAQKWGLTAENPGAQATLEIDSELGGLSSQLEFVQVHLLYLRSWSSMGRARLECSEGCTCEPQELDGHWDRKATLTDMFTLQASPHPSCQLLLTVLNSTSSDGHKFSVSGVVVSSLETKMERGKIGQWDYQKGGQ